MNHHSEYFEKVTVFWKTDWSETKFKSDLKPISPNRVISQSAIVIRNKDLKAF